MIKWNSLLTCQLIKGWIKLFVNYMLRHLYLWFDLYQDFLRRTRILHSVNLQTLEFEVEVIKNLQYRKAEDGGMSHLHGSKSLPRLQLQELQR